MNIWITGASTGIGKELALHYARQGHRVFASARSKQALAELAAQHPQHIVSIPVDITHLSQAHEAAQAISRHATSLDLVILNAGTCEYLNHGVIDSALVRRVMETNFMGAVYCSEAAMPLLEKASSPALYVVSSQVTALPITRSEAYGASKAAIEYFYRTLRIDWQPRNILVGIIRPGFVKTPLTDKNDFNMPGIWSADRAAQAIADGIQRRKLEIRFPWSLSLTLDLVALLPHKVWLNLSRRMMREGKSA